MGNKTGNGRAGISHCVTLRLLALRERLNMNDRQIDRQRDRKHHGGGGGVRRPSHPPLSCYFEDSIENRKPALVSHIKAQYHSNEILAQIVVNKTGNITSKVRLGSFVVSSRPVPSRNRKGKQSQTPRSSFVFWKQLWPSGPRPSELFQVSSFRSPHRSADVV